MNLARLCARPKPIFLSKKGPSKARLLTKMSSSEELGTLNTHPEPTLTIKDAGLIRTEILQESVTIIHGII